MIAYNSCRNRHSPKCQGAAAKRWLAEREADLLPVAYFHVVFTLPATIAAIAFTNKAAIYDLRYRWGYGGRCAGAFIARPGQELYPLSPRPDVVGRDLKAAADAILEVEPPD